MKRKMPSVLIFCITSAIIIGTLFIVLGGLLSRVNIQSAPALSSHFVTYFISAGVLSIVAAVPTFFAGLRFTTQRTLSGWLLIAAAIISFPTIIGLLTSVPLFKSAHDVFKSMPPFHDLFSVPSDSKHKTS